MSWIIQRMICPNTDVRLRSEAQRNQNNWFTFLSTFDVFAALCIV